MRLAAAAGGLLLVLVLLVPVPVVAQAPSVPGWRLELAPTESSWASGPTAHVWTTQLTVTLSCDRLALPGGAPQVVTVDLRTSQAEWTLLYQDKPSVTLNFEAAECAAGKSESGLVNVTQTFARDAPAGAMSRITVVASHTPESLLPGQGEPIEVTHEWDQQVPFMPMHQARFENPSAQVRPGESVTLKGIFTNEGNGHVLVQPMLFPPPALGKAKVPAPFVVESNALGDAPERDTPNEVPFRVEYVAPDVRSATVETVSLALQVSWFDDITAKADPARLSAVVQIDPSADRGGEAEEALPTTSPALIALLVVGSAWLRRRGGGHT